MNETVLLVGALSLTVMSGVDLFLGRQTFAAINAASLLAWLAYWAVRLR